MIVSEKQLDEQTEKLLTFSNYIFFKTHGSDRQRSGLPDFIAYRDNQLLCIENKNPNGKGTLKALQYVKLKALAAEGAVCIVSDNIEYTAKYMYDKGFHCPHKYEKQALKGLEECYTSANNEL